MNTPIVDFVKKYADSDVTRFHMPGHKGHVFFGCEPYDITEINGADVLYHGNGIIAESERNASKLFGSGATHYSACGSSTCIKAMLAMLQMESKKKDNLYLLAARNVHRSMIDACALLDMHVEFLKVKEQRHLCSSIVKAEDIEKELQVREELPIGVYITSPDYLGQIADIEGIALVCKKWNIPLLVDNAHGAYLHFLESAKHPMDLGAAMCCDSAHKTLPALTGAAYLHIHPDYLERFEPYATQALSLFSTTSPSYIIMQSLDLCNAYLADGYQGKLKERISEIEELKAELCIRGLKIQKAEPLKIVINTACKGYRGEEIAEELRKEQIEPEYADVWNVVLMLSVQNDKKDIERLKSWAEKTKLVCYPKAALPEPEKIFYETQRVMSIRKAVLSTSEYIPVAEACNRICAAQTVSCPPAIPIAVCGELITPKMIEDFEYFGITHISVVKKQ